MVYNNQNQGTLVCPICGTELLNQNVHYCPKCGSDFKSKLNDNNNNIANKIVGQHDLNNYQHDIEQNKKFKTKAIIFLIFSIINLLIVLPSVVAFSVLWLFFGALSNDTFQYYAILLCCCGYFASSIISPIAFIINLIKKGRVLKRSLLVIFISFCLGILTPIVLLNTNYSPQKAQIKKNTLIADKIVFQNDNLMIKQKKIDYDKYDVKVYFDLQTLQIDNYSFPLNVRVNGCITHADLERIEENYASYLYYISISYSDLKTYNIKDISMIDFDIYNKKDHNNINIDFQLNSNNSNMSSDDKVKSIGLSSDELIYFNDYFNLYFDSNYSSGSGRLYIQSNISDKYSLTFSNTDFDTSGYINDIFKNIELYDYSIKSERLFFHPCNENMHYIKFDYTIKNELYEEIAKENVELYFPQAKINTKYCQKSQ